MVLATTLLTLTSCASSDTLEWLRGDHADAIAEDLAIAVAARVPPSEVPVFVADMPLRDQFENAMRKHGYAVSADPEDAISIHGLGERIPPNTWHIGLMLDNGIRIHRLYRVDLRNVRALSSISVGDHPSEVQDTEPTGSSHWHLRTVPKATRTMSAKLSQHGEIDLAVTAHTATDSSLPVFEHAAPIPFAAHESDCPSTDGAVLTLNPGSLRRAIGLVLDRCEWTLATWPDDPDNDGYVVDWIIDSPMVIKANSLNSFLDQIERSYGIVAVRDPFHKTVSVTLAE